MSNLLTPRWTPLRPHPEQLRLLHSKARFKVVPAGRRSGKTEQAKRYTIREAYKAHRTCKHPDARFFFAAPTREQAKAIYWNDLKQLIPMEDVAGRPSETTLSIRLMNGSELHVIGMDKPERIEGRPWDGGILDEFANMKAGAWEENVRPALADRNGWCWLIGVPEGRNHYYSLYMSSLDPTREDWDGFTWKSIDILTKAEIESARRDLDELTFRQEFEADFVVFTGQAYYKFDPMAHVKSLEYNVMSPLIFTFDFNVAPGTAAVIQEQTLPSGARGTGVIDEVHIPVGSTTPAVCEKLITKFKHHKGVVRCYGDATGGSGGTAKVHGSDWELVEKALRPVFKNRLQMRNARSNPKERVRLNVVNSRLEAIDGTVRMMVDPKAKHVIKDFEGVRLKKGGSGAIDKNADPKLSHLTDGIGYYQHIEFPLLAESSLKGIGGMF